MSELPTNIAEYGKHARTKQRGHEHGTVKATGTRVKKWLGRYHVYERGADGTEVRRSRTRIIGECSKMTKSEARAEHAEWIKRLHSQPVATTQRSTIAALCDDYFELKQGDWEQSTRDINKVVFDLVKKHLGAIALEDVTPETLKTFVGQLATRKWYPRTRFRRPNGEWAEHTSTKPQTGISRSYASKIITKLRAIFDIAVERDLIRKNPGRSIIVRLTPPKAATRPDKTVLPPEEFIALLGHLEKGDALVVLLSMIAGTRPNELFALRGADVGPSWFMVQRALDRNRNFKDTKTSKSRQVLLPEQTAHELNAWIHENRIGKNDLVFTNIYGKPMSRETFLRRRLRKAAKRAKIATLTVDFQMLRRSFATVGHVLGLDIKSIQAQLGHSRPSMSLNEYIQPVDSARAAQLQRFEDVLRGKVPMPVEAAARIGSLLVQ